MCRGDIRSVLVVLPREVIKVKLSPRRKDTPKGPLTSTKREKRVRVKFLSFLHSLEFYPSSLSLSDAIKLWEDGLCVYRQTLFGIFGREICLSFPVSTSLIDFLFLRAIYQIVYWTTRSIHVQITRGKFLDDSDVLLRHIF